MEHKPGSHWRTPQKAVTQWGAKRVQSKSVLSPGGHIMTRRRLFTTSNVPPSSGYRIAKSEDPRRLNNSAIRKETRGRKKGLTERDIRRVEIILWTAGYDGRVLSWQNLVLEAELEVCGKTLQRTMRQKDYRRCKACRRSWVSPSLARRRVEFAHKMLTMRPKPKDWFNVRFSDEAHFGYGPPGPIYVTRTPAERDCPDCVQQTNTPRPEDQKKVHSWACIDYNYKSKLYRYKTNNSNGKMTQQVYISLLE